MTYWIVLIILVPLFARVLQNQRIRVRCGGKLIKINISALFSFLFLFVFRAFRKYTVGGDLLTYRVLFYRISDYSWPETLASQGYEKGFLAYNKILSNISKSLDINEKFQIILFVTAIIYTLALVYFIYDNSTDPAISLFIYIAFVFLGATFNNERQAIAISLLFFSFKYIKERRLFKFLILVMLAVLFHNTSIAFIVLYFAYNIKFSRKYWVIVSVGYCVTYAFSAVLLKYATTFYFQKYADVANEFSGSGYGYLLLLVSIVLSTFFFVSKAEREDPEMRLVIHMLVLSVFIQIFALKISFVFRATRLFSVAMIFYFPHIFKKIKNSIILVLIFFVVLFAYYYMSLSSDNLELVPFLWCWEY